MLKAMLHQVIRLAFIEGYREGLKRAGNPAPSVGALRYGDELAGDHADANTKKILEKVIG